MLTSPRCVNCHPAGDRPLQGDEQRLHIPAVQRGDGGMGVPGLRCTTCHQQANYDPPACPAIRRGIWRRSRWPGKAGRWAQICAQIKDPQRNGDRSLAELTDHMAHDSLVGWGWAPGSGREPAPGSQAAFGELIQAWVDTGAQCPP